MDSPSDITLNFILHKNIHGAAMVTIISKELGKLWEGLERDYITLFFYRLHHLFLMSEKKLLALCSDSIWRVLCLSRENTKLLAAKRLSKRCQSCKSNLNINVGIFLVSASRAHGSSSKANSATTAFCLLLRILDNGTGTLPIF